VKGRHHRQRGAHLGQPGLHQVEEQDAGGQPDGRELADPRDDRQQQGQETNHDPAEVDVRVERRGSLKTASPARKTWISRLAT
jgi:hypothetical protein